MPNVTIPVDHGQLEGHLDYPDNDPRARAVICHPHPEHGGTMHNKVVYHTAKALVDLDVVVLRFNFRGVGQSTGEFDDGIGEREDCRAALAYLRDQTSEGPLVLGGFSFGAMVALSLVDEIDPVNGALGVGLPVSLYDFSYLNDVPVPTLIIQGGRDEFGTPDELRAVLTEDDTRLTITTIPDTDHFLTDHYNELKRIIKNYYTTGDGATVIGAESTRYGRGIP